MKAAVLALALLGLLPATALPSDLPEPAGVERPSPGTWPDRTYRWYYNPQNHPRWLSESEAREWVQEAARQWEVCGVRMQYMGETDRRPLRADRTNVVGWRTDLPPRTRGLAGGRSANGKLLERDVAYSPDRPEFQRFPRLLKKVLVHEFGHAIGLTHPASCGDVMTLAASCAPVHPSQLPLSPTPGDLARCKALYP
ncbi:MAG: hypothetical protein HY854_02610 [Burkholderiales bacterium]|nr:hypothetical protein [Burkholderiales bacterium]